MFNSNNNNAMIIRKSASSSSSGTAATTVSVPSSSSLSPISSPTRKETIEDNECDNDFPSPNTFEAIRVELLLQQNKVHQMLQKEQQQHEQVKQKHQEQLAQKEVDQRKQEHALRQNLKNEYENALRAKDAELEQQLQLIRELEAVIQLEIKEEKTSKSSASPVLKEKENANLASETRKLIQDLRNHEQQTKIENLECQVAELERDNQSKDLRVAEVETELADWSIRWNEQDSRSVDCEITKIQHKHKRSLLRQKKEHDLSFSIQETAFEKQKEELLRLQSCHQAELSRQRKLKERCKLLEQALEKSQVQTDSQLQNQVRELQELIATMDNWFSFNSVTSAPRTANAGTVTVDTHNLKADNSDNETERSNKLRTRRKSSGGTPPPRRSKLHKFRKQQKRRSKESSSSSNSSSTTTIDDAITPPPPNTTSTDPYHFFSPVRQQWQRQSENTSVATSTIISSNSNSTVTPAVSDKALFKTPENQQQLSPGDSSTFAEICVRLKELRRKRDQRASAILDKLVKSRQRQELSKEETGNSDTPPMSVTSMTTDMSKEQQPNPLQRTNSSNDENEKERVLQLEKELKKACAQLQASEQKMEMLEQFVVEASQQKVSMDDALSSSTVKFVAEQTTSPSRLEKVSRVSLEAEEKEDVGKVEYLNSNGKTSNTSNSERECLDLIAAGSFSHDHRVECDEEVQQLDQLLQEKETENEHLRWDLVEVKNHLTLSQSRIKELEHDYQYNRAKLQELAGILSVHGTSQAEEHLKEKCLENAHLQAKNLSLTQQINNLKQECAVVTQKNLKMNLDAVAAKKEEEQRREATGAVAAANDQKKQRSIIGQLMEQLRHAKKLNQTYEDMLDRERGMSGPGERKYAQHSAAETPPPVFSGVSPVVLGDTFDVCNTPNIAGSATEEPQAADALIRKLLQRITLLEDQNYEYETALCDVNLKLQLAEDALEAAKNGDRSKEERQRATGTTGGDGGEDAALNDDLDLSKASARTLLEPSQAYAC